VAGCIFIHSPRSCDAVGWHPPESREKKGRKSRKERCARGTLQFAGVYRFLHTCAGVTSPQNKEQHLRLSSPKQHLLGLRRGRRAFCDRLTLYSNAETTSRGILQIDGAARTTPFLSFFRRSDQRSDKIQLINVGVGSNLTCPCMVENLSFPTESNFSEVDTVSTASTNI